MVYLLIGKINILQKPNVKVLGAAKLTVAFSNDSMNLSIDRDRLHSRRVVLGDEVRQLSSEQRVRTWKLESSGMHWT